jgi:fructoselysine-6-P-deglycase FrlB-like protein
VNTINTYEKDVLLQVKFLKTLKIKQQFPKIKQNQTIFCGSGDSFASAMLAEAHSQYTVKAFDPLDLLKNKSLLQKNDVFIVSISGKTISNIKVGRQARKSIAITSNPKSKLAQTCKHTIPLKFPNSDVFTAGSISFLDSALTCISLIKKFKIQNPDSIFKEAQKQSKKVKFGKKVYFLGDLYTYPIAMYAAAKIFEILGITAFYERLEQFSHMELFSTTPGDTVIIFEHKTHHNSRLEQNLKKAGLKVFHPILKNHDKISEFLFYTFFSQLVPLNLAKEKKQKECHFVTSKKLRKISDNMIY